MPEGSFWMMPSTSKPSTLVAQPVDTGVICLAGPAYRLMPEGLSDGPYNPRCKTVTRLQSKVGMAYPSMVMTIRQLRRQARTHCTLAFSGQARVTDRRHIGLPVRPAVPHLPTTCVTDQKQAPLITTVVVVWW